MDHNCKISSAFHKNNYAFENACYIVGSSLINLRHLPQPPEFGIVVVEDPGESDVKKHNKKPLPFLKKCFHFVLKMI